MFIDTHTHLYSEQYKDDRTEMIQRALQAGVERFYIPNIDLESISGMHELEQQSPMNCFGMMGLHPCSVDANWEVVLAQMKLHIDQRNYAAIGEIGIDLYWDKTFLEEQKMAFRVQIRWAKELGWPIVIHAREAFNEIFEVLDEENDERLKGIFHCFTGSRSEINKIQSYGGFYFGIGGVITYKKTELADCLTEIPLDRLLLETDAPYLAPIPYRGKRNESSYLVHTAEKIADLYRVQLSEIRDVTSRNAINLFHH